MEEHRIVVVEDDPLIADSVAARLRAEGFDVDVAADGPAGVELCARVRPDLVVLDVMLPGFDGIEVCRRLQAARPVAVVMLTARDAEVDKLVGLGVGADDYVTKPFSTRELVARIRAVLRRVDRAAATGTDDRIRAGTLDIDPSAHRVHRDGAEVATTPTELALLHYLARHPGRVFAREHLLAEVWGYADGTGARTVDSHVAALRRKLGAEVIRTAHGIGYAFGDEPA